MNFVSLMLKSNRPGVFYKKGVLKNFIGKFIGAVSFLLKLQALSLQLY